MQKITIIAHTKGRAPRILLLVTGSVGELSPISIHVAEYSSSTRCHLSREVCREKVEVR